MYKLSTFTHKAREMGETHFLHSESFNPRSHRLTPAKKQNRSKWHKRRDSRISGLAAGIPLATSPEPFSAALKMFEQSSMSELMGVGCPGVESIHLQFLYPLHPIQKATLFKHLLLSTRCRTHDRTPSNPTMIESSEAQVPGALLIWSPHWSPRWTFRKPCPVP